METLIEFAEVLKKELRAVLPKRYKNIELEIIPMKKINKEYTGLSISNPDTKVYKVLNLEETFDKYCDGMKLDDIVDEIALEFQKEIPDFDVDWMTDYSVVKNKLFYRIYNASDLTNILQDVPHKKFADLVLTYYILIRNENGGLISAIVKNEMMEKYGVSLEEFEKDAEISAMKLFPASIEKYVPPGSKEWDGKMVVITNPQDINGAAALFYPGVLEKVTEIFGNRIMIIPSSIHEVFAIGKKSHLTTHRLDEMIENGNAALCEEQEIVLSSHGYIYDCEYGVLETTREYEVRTGKNTL